MSRSEPLRKSVSLDEFQRKLAELVDEVASGASRITIEERGKELVYIEPAVSRRRREIDALMEDSEFAALASISDELKDVPLDELEEQVAEALRKGREKRRQERHNFSNS